MSCSDWTEISDWSSKQEEILFAIIFFVCGGGGTFNLFTHPTHIPKSFFNIKCSKPTTPTYTCKQTERRPIEKDRTRTSKRCEQRKSEQESKREGAREKERESHRQRENVCLPKALFGPAVHIFQGCYKCLEDIWTGSARARVGWRWRWWWGRRKRWLGDGGARLEHLSPRWKQPTLEPLEPLKRRPVAVITKVCMCVCVCLCVCVGGYWIHVCASNMYCPSTSRHKTFARGMVNILYMCACG